MFHAHCGMNATFVGSCEKVFDSILTAVTRDLRPDVVGGMYNLIQAEKLSYIRGTRLTGDKKYTDDIVFEF